MKSPIVNIIIKVFKSSPFWSICIFVAFVIMMLSLVQTFSTTVSDEQISLLENAVRRSAIQCYVIEGSYPPDVQYLVDNYGLYYDENYIVHYQNQGGNLLPEIDVFHLE